MKRRNVRTLSLIVATFTYLLIGAAVFDALEGPHNENAFEALNKVKADIMAKYNMTEEDYKLMELLIIERKPHKNGPQWKFAGKIRHISIITWPLISIVEHRMDWSCLRAHLQMVYVKMELLMLMFKELFVDFKQKQSVIVQKRRFHGFHVTKTT